MPTFWRHDQTSSLRSASVNCFDNIDHLIEISISTLCLTMEAETSKFTSCLSDIGQDLQPQLREPDSSHPRSPNLTNILLLFPVPKSIMMCLFLCLSISLRSETHCSNSEGRDEGQ